jgi:hypothetical protein
VTEAPGLQLRAPASAGTRPGGLPPSPLCVSGTNWGFPEGPTARVRRRSREGLGGQAGSPERHRLRLEEGTGHFLQPEAHRSGSQALCSPGSCPVSTPLSGIQRALERGLRSLLGKFSFSPFGPPMSNNRREWQASQHTLSSSGSSVPRRLPCPPPELTGPLSI